MTYLDLYTAAIDWFTATSFESEFEKYWQKVMRDNGKGEPEQRAVMQYSGSMFELDRGTGFVGTAFQKGVYHYMLRLSGGSAEDYKDQVFSGIRQRFATCTRLDLQVTVPMPGKWSQFNLLKRLQESGKITGWVESRGREGRFETVYIGGRSSDRFIRVYVKKNGEDRLLRLEAEYKGDRARAMAKHLADGQSTPARFLTHELQKTIKDDELRLLFEPSLNDAAPLTMRIKTVKSADKTEKWLLEQVYASFQRHINDHDASGRVLAAFYSACTEAIEQDDND